MKLNINSRIWDEIDPIDMIDDDGTILSTSGEVTVGWELFYPPVFSIGADVYDAMHQSMNAAIKALPDWTLVHRQDVYMDSAYQPDESRTSFLDRAYERHFAGRRYPDGKHYLYLTLSTKASCMRGPFSSGLFGLSLTKTLPSPMEMKEFLAQCEEFITVWCTGSPLKARRLTKEDLDGPDGLIEKVKFLGQGQSGVELHPDSVRINDSRTMVFSICDTSSVPMEIDTVRVKDKTSVSEIVTSQAAPIGTLFFGHPHINNLYIIKPNQQNILVDLDKTIIRQGKFSTDGANVDNAAENTDFIHDMYAESLCAVYAHANIISWGSSEEEMLRIRGDVSAALTTVGLESVRVLDCVPMLWYSSIPGAGCSLSKDNLMLCELRAALTMTSYEGYDRGLPRGTFKFTDRLRRIPLTLDVQAAAASAGIIANYNMFVNGASGTGKSFTTSSILYGMWSHGEHVFIVDIGGSYEQVCAVINEESGGVDGIYNRWDVSHPFSFNPFHRSGEWFDGSGQLKRDDPSLNFLISLLLTLGSDKEKGIVMGDFEESVIMTFVTRFLRSWADSHEVWTPPVFDDFFLWTKAFLLYGSQDGELEGTMRAFITDSGVRVDQSNFHGGRFIESMSAYRRDGQFGFLLNASEPKDLFTSRFTVFDVGELSNVNNVKFYSICILCIVNAFDIKMRSKNIDGFKVMAIDEAWKAISNETMAPYLRELWKTARKMNTSAMVITQELDDILSSDIIKETILQNSDVKILLNQDSYKNSPERLAEPMGLSKMDLNLIFSMSSRKDGTRDVFIKWGSTRAGVYAVEACIEHLWAFESNIEKKKPLWDKARELGGVLKAIEYMADNKIYP